MCSYFFLFCWYFVSFVSSIIGNNASRRSTNVKMHPIRFGAMAAETSCFYHASAFILILLPHLSESHWIACATRIYISTGYSLICWLYWSHGYNDCVFCVLWCHFSLCRWYIHALRCSSSYCYAKNITIKSYKMSCFLVFCANEEKKPVLAPHTLNFFFFFNFRIFSQIKMFSVINGI